MLAIKGENEEVKQKSQKALKEVQKNPEILTFILRTLSVQAVPQPGLITVWIF